MKLSSVHVDAQKETAPAAVASQKVAATEISRALPT